MTDKRTTLEIADRMCDILFRKEFKELTETEKQELKKFILECEGITIK
tara:strand:- start:1139 stop:1282 length:144 start_codon:yes stop_codon:yes gene_type:complete